MLELECGDYACYDCLEDGIVYCHICDPVGWEDMHALYLTDEG